MMATDTFVFSLKIIDLALGVYWMLAAIGQHDAKREWHYSAFLSLAMLIIGGWI
jgi:hypothetical protein